MNETTTKQQQPEAVQTTGHAWDGDLQEFNNPLPRWWLWTFYGTAIFCLIYWFIYPSWPVGDTWLKGTKTVTYQAADGQEQEMRWNTRSRLLHDLQSSSASERQQQYLEKVAAASFADILNNPDQLAFARSIGRGLFGDNCAACHGRGGQGVVGMYPNLADDDWLWGGTMDNIQTTLVNGRNGFMPSFKETLTAEQLDDVAEYVMTLSGEAKPSEAAERGRALFQGKVGGCYMCHGQDGKGLHAMGAANLTDKIWTVANVPAQQTPEQRKSVVKETIWNGIQRQMPGWQERLSPTDIKLLAVYVHELGGGQ